MFTGTDKEYREAVRQTNDLGAQITELLNKIEEVGAGVVATRGTAQIAGPTFTIRRTNNRWIYSS
ncbi:hypothetical protein OOK06_36635 [Streptomyces sp. NBC_00340]|uniref:hypothetical protein n=1 Tax=Streptomyces sp. NBC_00340 TaxID=2975716 RepID=UPI00225C3AA1|nr:hypothetical protein [Streptomyces sp. NBC_00340]MCX5137598.1 hypothetical protein [Streptomyces sp. NBC_00340]